MRKFCFYLVVTFLLAAFVFSMGGCGGNSGGFPPGNNGNSENESIEKSLSNALVSSDMASVMHGSEWLDLINEFEESGSGDKMNYHTWVYCISDEEAQKLREKYADDELNLAILEALLFNADTISRDYANEYDILLIYPNEDFINRTLEAVGLEPNYVMEDNETRLELFAIAKRTVNGRTFRFSYRAFMGDDAVLTDVTASNDAAPAIDSGDVELDFTEDETPTTDDSDTTENDGRIFFNIERWRSYYNWCASLTDMANESDVEATAIEVRAAADDDLTKIADAQSDILDFSRYQDYYDPWTNVYYDAVEINRTNQISVKVYNCHSFKYSKDYYLVQTNASTYPKNIQDRLLLIGWSDKELRDYVHYLSGYTGAFGFDAYIENANNKNADFSTSQVGLVDHIPLNVPKQSTVTKGIDWSIGGQIGLNKDGPSISLTSSISHSSSETWTTSDWDISDKSLQSKNASVSWLSDITGPSNSDTQEFKAVTRFDGTVYRLLNSTTASRQTLSFKSEWIWEVDKSVWSKQPSNTLPMKVNFFWQEGFCYGEGIHYFSMFQVYSWGTTRTYPRFDVTKTMNLVMPRHSWVEQKIFDISGNGDKSAGLGFSILSEGKWTVSSNANWITFTNSSGEATGETMYPIRFQVAENNTGSPRQARITFTAQVGDNFKEESTLYVNQASK